MLSIMTIGLYLGACHQRQRDEWVEWGGPNRPTSLVIFFNRGTSREEINAFWQNVLQIEEYKIAFIFRVLNNGYEGVGVNFSTEATPDQRERLKRSVEDSQIVYRVYENVVPWDVIVE